MLCLARKRSDSEDFLKLSTAFWSLRSLVFAFLAEALTVLACVAVDAADREVVKMPWRRRQSCEEDIVVSLTERRVLDFVSSF